MEPFFTVLFSTLLLSERPTLWVVASLVPILGVVALASFTEASFDCFIYDTRNGITCVTHAVGNYVKRVVVIVSSILFFRTPVSPVNSLGTGLALARVFLYTIAKQIKPKAD
ncbi:hypothetical protein CTI12_AA442660 [Artemisia annua]|uniref:Sugar phosphate transporter domain-containing protein n=1 Tax=Artemisia annua TaxID=35608 RepID=A0A2U1LXE7_ARTAN|nr:hypothetical protein CTI12_AA442660 [Artemisia annua]